MSELFDMMAGTSTGGLLSTALSIPSFEDKTIPRYTSDDIIKVYTTEGPTVFKKYTEPPVEKWIYISVFGLIGGLLGLLIGRAIFINKQQEQTFKMLTMYKKARKQTIKGKGNAEVENDL